MRTRTWLAGFLVGAALLAGGSVATAQAAPAAAGESVKESSALALYWTDSGERFNRLAPCDTRGSWYWDNYSNVYSWDCRWNATNRNYQLWLQKG
ncbi:hypothetical protein [Streptomyces sp. NPDC093260]|uniref:hypothetical protein n=1 Tax=Streptomyces sp. NPDC093260 TaxID=3155073 RepID=UPI0034499CE8